MYQVVCITDGTEYILMDMRDEEYTLVEPKLTCQLNSAGTFTFKIAPTHPEIDHLKKLVTVVKVYKTDGIGRKWKFSGRVMSDEKDIYNTGKVECEGILAYLLDSVVYPYEYQGTPADYVSQLISSHNSQVDAPKRFKIRTLDLADADSNNNIVRANRNYPTTSQEMKDKVVKLLNAYISAEETDGGLVFDCTQTMNVYNSQEIQLGSNIIDLKQTASAGTLRTVMIGIGAEDDNGDRINVTVEDKEAVERYGRIVGTVEFEDVTTMDQLTRKTKTYLETAISETLTVEIKAVDLNMTDSEVEEIQIGYAYVNSEYNGFWHERMMITKKELYLMQPDKNTITLGTDKQSLSSSVSHSSLEINSRVKSIANSMTSRINDKVTNATQLITGAKGGYVVLDCGDNADQHPEQILIMDAPDKEEAVNVIRINKNGIGFSTSGYDGIYRNAWTIDGNLVADFITTGTMLADRISGGSLTLGGYDNVNGVFYIKDANGVVKITEDVNGINVNNKFKVNMEGNMEAVSISGEAINQINTIIDNSQAMKTAKEALQTAQEAASRAQETANTANSAAQIAQTTADTADSTAQTAYATAENLRTAVNNNAASILIQNNWINQLSAQVQALGQPGIS